MRELSLFTGAGGGVYASILLGHTLVGYCEIDDYCRSIISHRIDDGIFHRAPIYRDVARDWTGMQADVVSAGFPCQPFSVAGQRSGEDDERNKWPETLACIAEVKPRYVFLENSPALLGAAARGYWGEILRQLASIGYHAAWRVLGADQVGAPHIRKRLWCVATNPNRPALRQQQRGSQQGCSPALLAGEQSQHGHIADLRPRRLFAPGANSDSVQRLRKCRELAQRRRWAQYRDAAALSHADSRPWEAAGGDGPWNPKPGIQGVADGVANITHRQRCTGNGQVPLLAALAFEMLRRRIEQVLGGGA